MRPPPLLLGSSGVVVCTSWSRLTYVPTKYPQPTFSPPKKKTLSGFNVWASSHPLTFLSRIRSILFSSFPFFCSVLHSVKSAFTEIVRRREILLCSDLSLPQRASAPPEIVWFLLGSCYQKTFLESAISSSDTSHWPNRAYSYSLSFGDT